MNMRGDPRELASVLIVDDDLDYAESQLEFLEDNGYHCLAAFDEQSAIELIRGHQVGVALVDIRIGRDRGVELIRAIKQYDPQIVCIMVTAYASISAAVDAIKQGAFEYLTKPVNPESLLATLELAYGLLKLHHERDRARIELEREQERSHLPLEATGDGASPTHAHRYGY